MYISFSPLNYNHHLLSNGTKSLYYTFVLAPDLLCSNICCISFLESFGIFICFSECSCPIIFLKFVLLKLALHPQFSIFPFCEYPFLAISSLNFMQTAGAIGGFAASLVRVPTEVDFAAYAFLYLEQALLFLV